jgi:putative ABC transport system permease protein
MLFKIPLAWLQLKKEKLRLLVAAAGIGFAVILVFMQLGFLNGLFDSSVRYHKRLDCDLVLISPDTPYLCEQKYFSRRRLYQAAGFAGVESVSSVYLAMGVWKNPVNNRTRPIFVVAFDPADRVLDVPGVTANLNKIRMPDVVLYDALSRPEFGPIAERVRAGEEVTTEVVNRKVSVVGLFEVGTSFGIDASLVTSDLNFLRLFPHQSPGLINLGLIKLKPGFDPEVLRDAIASKLPNDVLVLTKQDYIDREINWWESSTPIGYALTFGVIVGLVVGAIIVYQILFSDVTNHLAEYATLRALGYPMSFLVGVVLQEAVILSLLGYLPATGISLGLYHIASKATQLPLDMTLNRGISVLGLTVLMCAVAGLIAVRKLRTADPAEVF